MTCDSSDVITNGLYSTVVKIEYSKFSISDDWCFLDWLPPRFGVVVKEPSLLLVEKLLLFKVELF